MKFKFSTVETDCKMRGIHAADRGELYPVSSEPATKMWGLRGCTKVRDVCLKVVEMREGQSDVCSVPAGAASEGKVFHHVDLWPLYNRYHPIVLLLLS